MPHKKCGTHQINSPNKKIVKTLADEIGTCARGFYIYIYMVLLLSTLSADVKIEIELNCIYIYLTNKEAKAVYYTVIKHDGNLRTRGKCRKHEPQASVFYISRVFSNVLSVLLQCNTRLRLYSLGDLKQARFLD